MDGFVSNIPFTTASLIATCLSVLSVAKSEEGTASTSTSSAEPGTSRMFSYGDHDVIEDTVINDNSTQNLPVLHSSSDSQLDAVLEAFESETVVPVISIPDDDSNDFVPPETPAVQHPQRKVSVAKKQLGTRRGSISKSAKSSIGGEPSRLREMLTKLAADVGNKRRLLPSSATVPAGDVGTGVRKPFILHDGRSADEVFGIPTYIGWQKEVAETRTLMNDIRQNIAFKELERAETQEKIRRLQAEISALEYKDETMSNEIAADEKKFSALHEKLEVVLSDMRGVSNCFEPPE